MCYRKTLAAVFVLFLVLSVSGFESERGGGEGDTEYTEDIRYDMQASWIFEDGSPSTSGPSIYYGSEVIEEFEDADPDHFEDEALTTGEQGNLRYFYVEDSDQEWGQGEIREVISSQYFVTDDSRTDFDSLIAPPSDVTTWSQDHWNCGDGNQHSAHDEFSCPQDYGLPANQYTGSGESYSNQDISSQFSPISRSAGNKQRTADVEYDIDMWAVEGSNENCGSDDDACDYDVSDYEEDTTDVLSFNEYGDWGNGPDFFIEDGTLMMVYPEIAAYTRDFDTTIENEYISDSDKSTVEEYTAAGNVYTSCGPSENCTISGSACTAISSSEYTHYQTSDVQTFVTANAPQRLENTGDGDGGYSQSDSLADFELFGSVEILRELHVRPVIPRDEGPPEVADSPVY